MDAYSSFLANKAMVDPPTGITGDISLPEAMFQFQKDITNWALKRGRAALFEGTGLGKSLQELAWGAEVAKETRRPVLHFAPLAVTAQMRREAIKFGVEPQTIVNYQKLAHYQPSDFGGVILDECFASGTPIDMANGSKKHIEKIRVGDRIKNASGKDVVSDVHRREVPYAIKVRYAGNAIICSPNHPFLCERGWIGAQDLEPGDALVETGSAMRMVRSEIHSDHSNRTLLRAILLSEMANATTGNIGEGSCSGSRSEARPRSIGMVSSRFASGRKRKSAHCGIKSHGRSIRARKDIPDIETHEARTFRAWGKWSANDESAVRVLGGSWVSVGSGIRFITGPTDSGISDLLQVRLGERRIQSRHRGGWSLASFAQTSGREERCEGGRIRLEGVEVLELGNPELDQYRDADGKLYFYDLGGTRHPSFSVNGALVHNSSILKNESGHYRNELISACSDVPFRLAATATPAPNDFMELGNHAEFLGVMSYTDMLSTFFVHDGGETQKWRLKGHAENEFWRWMASWAVMLRKPSDLGYSDDGYNLPPLKYHMHSVEIEHDPDAMGTLFATQANTLSERLAARRGSIAERIELAASLAPADRPFVFWTNLNAEADALAKRAGAVNLHGSLADDEKERIILDFCDGKIERLVTKPSIMSQGINAQVCADTCFVGLNDSWEQFYQAVRRFWRFGQTKPVNVHVVAAETEGATVANIWRKEADADRMATAMVRHMKNFNTENVRGLQRDMAEYAPLVRMDIPAWLQGQPPLASESF